MDALIAEDSELAIFHREVDQDTIAILCLFHLESEEQFCGPVDRIHESAPVLNEDAYLSAGSHFRRADGFDDALLIRFGEMLLCRPEAVEDVQ
jgi:hypothetical protein